MADANPIALPGTDPKLFARFMDRVEITDACWLFHGGGRHRYGYIKVGARDRLAHRVAYAMFVAPIPAGLHVLHTCDVTKCVNPAHLWLGTHLDNMRDRSAKGRCNPPAGDRNGSRRHPERVERGARRWNAKLSDDSVREIRRLYAAGLLQREIGDIFGVSQVLVSWVVRRRGWAHVS